MKLVCAMLLAASLLPSTLANAQNDPPGTVHRVPNTLPPLRATLSASRPATIVPWPPDVMPRVPLGFTITAVAAGLRMPRTLRTAPNGDVFLAESGAGRILVFRPQPGTAHFTQSVFASGLNLPFGIGFWPPGPDPRYVYVAETNRVVRFPYAEGTRPSGAAEIIVRHLPEGGHWTRDLVFDPAGRTMLVSVGSGSDVATELMSRPPPGLAPGAAWGEETDRAVVLAFDPDGHNKRVYAAGLRNCSAMAIKPGSGVPWCVVNERDGLGDDLPPDFATSVQQGGFYGWPWFYIGAHGDPLFEGARRDLASVVRTPEVLIQAHSAPLGIAFYDAAAFPPEYRGDAFVALHGSWNRSTPTGFKVVRLRFENGAATGEYEDFVTGFVAPRGSPTAGPAAGGFASNSSARGLLGGNTAGGASSGSDAAGSNAAGSNTAGSNTAGSNTVWGRPVGVTVTAEGDLLISEDANGTVWRVTYTGGKQ